MTTRLITYFIFFFLLSTTVSAGQIGSRLCKDSRHYECYTVKRGDSWQKLFPNERQRALVMHINRLNIRLHPGMRIAIPHNLNASIMDHAPFPKQISPPGRKLVYISIHPDVLAWGAYSEQGGLVRWGPAVGARGYCPDVKRSCKTSLGKFSVYRKGGSRCASSKYPVGKGGAPMPYCMFFNGGYAMHGSYDVPGVNASHGCVRMFIPDAQWLNQEFIADERNVAVTVINRRP